MIIGYFSDLSHLSVMENRVIGMVLVATQTTGITLVFGSWEGFFHISDLLFLDMVFNVVDKAKCCVNVSVKMQQSVNQSLTDLVVCWFNSTKSMREEGGYAIIKEAINKLGLRHKEHIASYGEGNERRLTGRHETADMNSFSWVRLFYNCNHCYVIKTLLYQPKP